MKRVRAALSAVLTASLAASLAAGIDGASAAPQAAGAAAYVPSIDFYSCGIGEECADFEVPLDYANPASGPANRITLSVRKRLHDPKAGSYRGVMLANPGGPGASGTGLVALADAVPGKVGQRYDWVGFDPRGVGESVPALHCNPRYFGVDRPGYVPRTKRLMRRWKARTRRYAARCADSSAARLLPHMSTWDTVQDMNSLRRALVGEGGKISFYGFSYGTYLGQVFATRYPDKVDRFVLDGLVDPTDYWYRANLKQERGFDRNLNEFFRWVARHPHAYHLGTSWRAIRAGYQQLLRRLDRRPAAKGRLGPDELTDAILNAGYYVYQWDYIAAAYSRLVRRNAGGAMFGLYRDMNMGAEAENGYAVYLAVQCTDAAAPRWRKQVRDAWRIHRKRPFLAWDNTWYNAPCRTWSAPVRARLRVSGAAAAAHGGKFLLVNETKDAATPYSGALRVRSLFPSSRLIAGVGGTTHAGSLSGVSCVDDRIARFLADGVLPKRLSGTRADVRCPKVPVPYGRYTTTGGRFAPVAAASGSFERR